MNGSVIVDMNLKIFFRKIYVADGHCIIWYDSIVKVVMECGF